MGLIQFTKTNCNDRLGPGRVCLGSVGTCADRRTRPCATLSGHNLTHRSARGRSCLAHDPGRKGIAAGKSGSRDSASSGSPLTTMERRSSRRRRAGFATVFPQAIGLAATWDASLLHDVATVIGTEARAKYHEAVRQGRRESSRASTSGRRTSISSAIRAGAAARKPTAKTRSSPRAWAWLLSPGCRATTRNICASSRRPNTSPSTAGPSPLRHKFDVTVSHARRDGYLSAGIPRHHRRRSCRLHHVRLQQHQWRAGLRQQLPARRSASRRMAIQRLCCVGLRRGHRHLAGHHFSKTQAEAAAVSLKRGMDNECVDFTLKIPDNPITRSTSMP